MHIRLSKPEALPELLAALNERVNYVARPIAADAIAVSVLGSFADGGEDDLRTFLAEWQSDQPGLDAQVELDADNASNVRPLRR